MVRTIKYSLVLSLLLVLGVITNYSQAATLTIENNTNLTLLIEKKIQYDSAVFAGLLPPLSERKISLKSGYWDFTFKAVDTGPSTERYPSITKSLIINEDTDVKSIVLYDRDFGKSFIAGPGCDPSVKGKYSNYLRSIRVPDDGKKYGRCHDFGQWTGTSYKGFDNLPKGYWVYMYPNWYIWGDSKTGKTSTKKTGGCDTTMGGKYSNKLQTVSVPGDESQYGKCYDYGWWGNTEYKGYKNLPKGYWVYDPPNWVIYGKKR